MNARSRTESQAVFAAFVLALSLPSRLLAASILPIAFERTIDAATVKTGDVVRGKTIQAATIDGIEVPSGTIVVGHIVRVRPYQLDATPYAKQQPSVLALRFDRVLTGDKTVELTAASIRAIAHAVDSRRARSAQFFDEHDLQGTIVQIGGDAYRPESEPVFSPDGDIVGYNRKGGVVARPLASEYTTRFAHVTCDGDSTEQPFAMFSAGACGVYGFDDVHMVQSGREDPDRTIRFESHRHSVKIYGGSTALLQVDDALR